MAAGDIRQCRHRLRSRWQRECRHHLLQFGNTGRVGRQRIFRVEECCQDVGHDIIIGEAAAGRHHNTVITGIYVNSLTAIPLGEK